MERGQEEPWRADGTRGCGVVRSELMTALAGPGRRMGAELRFWSDNRSGKRRWRAQGTIRLGGAGQASWGAA